MKQITLLSSTMLLILSLTACGASDKSSSVSFSNLNDTSSSSSSKAPNVNSNSAAEANPALQQSSSKAAVPDKQMQPNSDAASDTQSAKKHKVLIAYFSCTGTTKALAEYAADTLNADLYQIQPEVPYTADDLNYNNSASRCNKEQNDDTARPAISGNVKNMQEYDIVFVGYPIWWGQAPRIISTFLEGYDFSGKTIVPFCTSGSSGLGSSAKNLHAICSNTATWLSGTRFSGSASKNDMVNWINGLGLNIAAK